MEVALYHPELGYYRRGRDPFGRSGDFFTASQLQPVFGMLVRRALERLMPGNSNVLEVGPGRGEMGFPSVELGELWPGTFEGIFFSNELFDALPVDVVQERNGIVRERLVGFDGTRFVWVAGARSQVAATGEDVTREIPCGAVAMMDRMCATLTRGFLVTVDYGYTEPELARFPEGTLMSYRRHLGLEDVLLNPGEQDISAHVNFTALERLGALRGLKTRGFATLSKWLLDAGEEDRFAAILAEDAAARTLQLKTLLFGMGETFRVLVQEK